MPSNITDSDTFTATVTGIADGEPLSKAYLTDLAPQALANRTRYLYNRLPAGAGGEIAVPIIGIDASDATFAFSGGSPRWASNTNTPIYHIPVALVFGAKLVSIKATIRGSGSLGSLPSQMPFIALYRRDRNSPVGGVLVGDATDASASLGAYQAAHDVEYVLPTPRAFDDFEFTIYIEGDDGAAANWFLDYVEMVVSG